MSPAKRTTTGKRASRAATTTDREVSLPSAPDNPDTLLSDADDLSPESRSFAPLRMTTADDDTEQRIRHRAYEIYCSRNADDGNELDDWLAAEREVRFGHASTEGRAPTLLESLSDDERRDVAG
jgi:hypothetical protein